MTESKVVHVDIQGQRYAVRSTLDPKYVADLASFVDERLDSAARQLSTSDAARIAVIAALNIADELFRTREDAAATGAEARMAQLERLVDAALDQTSAPQADVRIQKSGTN